MQVYSIRVILLLFLLVTGGFVQAQGIQTEFGKNRVQYSRDFDEWLQYESQNFITYWYGEGRMVGQAAVMIAEQEHDEIQQLLEHRMNDKIEILVYTDLTDLKQSNIGTEEAFTNVTGKTKIYGNKIFVYFNGDHQHLRKQIREGIAEVYLDAMLFGGNLQEYVQNAILFNMPIWFKEGLIAYIGDEWNTETDDQLRALLRQEGLTSFEDVVKENPELAGHAFWYYLSRQFGRQSVANILYIARIYRDVEEGMLYVLGTPFPGLTTGWYSFFQERYANDAVGFSPPTELQPVPVRNRRNVPIMHVEASPDGRHLAYVLNRDGKIKVYVQDLQTGDRKKVMQYAFRNPFQETDYQYPLIAWHPSSQFLALLSEKRDLLELTILDLLSGEKEVQELAPIYQRVYSMHYFDNHRLVFSGATGGLSDIFLYHIPTRQSDRITQDPWDDLEPVPFTFQGKKGILFTSNRPSASLAKEKLNTLAPTATLDLYFYNLDDRPADAVRITATPRSNERMPVTIDSTWFAWLTDESGLYNRSLAYLDSVLVRTDRAFLLDDGTQLLIHADTLPLILPPPNVDSTWDVPVWEIQAFSHPASNVQTHIQEQSYAERTGMMYDLQHVGKSYQIVGNPVHVDSTVVPYQTAFARPATRKSVPGTRPAIPQLYHPRKDTVVHYFQTPFQYPPVVLPTTEPTPDLLLEEGPSFVILEARQLIQSADSTSQIDKFVTSRIIPSRLKFRLDYLTNRFDNSLLFGGLDNYSGRQFLNLDEGSSRFAPPATGLLIKANVKDLLEDYEFEGGMRLPTNFRGSEFFLTFMDKKHRWDKHYSIYRGDWSNIFELNNNVLNGPAHLIPPGLGAPGSPTQYKVRLQTTLGQVQWRYPLDIFRSIRLRTTLRNDRYFWHALEQSTLVFPAVNEQRLGLRAEYVFDNTLTVAPNILNGMRYNIFTEVVKGFQIQADPFTFDLNQGFMGMAGVDFRYYYPILKHSVFAFRFNGVTSFGQERILFYLGGVDNWLLPQFNEDIPINNTNYGFQTLAANLRGFQYNIRNGSSFALANLELRVPFIKYLFPRTRSSFFRNLQVTGFFDTGTAWEGLSPYSDDNPLNIIYIENPPAVQVKLKYFRDPLVAGYGVGARTLIFGYLVKLDYAWGIETRQVQKPILYLSIGSDF